MDKDVLGLKAIRVASGFFLCKMLPDEWVNYTDEQLDKFLEENVWEPLEGYSACFILEQIENAANDIAYFAEKIAKES